MISRRGTAPPGRATGCL